MKQTLFLKFIFFSAAATVFYSTLTHASQSKCKDCDATIALQNSLEKLDYNNSDDRFKGDQIVQKSMEQFQRFQKMPKSNSLRGSLFKELLILTRSAGPYDGESQLADLLAVNIKADRSLKEQYSKYLTSISGITKMSEICKNKRLETSVETALCRIKGGVIGQDPVNAKQASAAKSCVKPFNYESCASLD